MKFIKLSVAALSLMVLPMIAQAEPSRIVGKCEFEAPDQEQGDDCHAKFVICKNEPNGPAPIEGLNLALNQNNECESYLKVTCGKTVVNKSEADVTHENGEVVVTGDDAEVEYEAPDSFPATVDATLSFDDTELEGECHVKKVHGRM